MIGMGVSAKSVEKHAIKITLGMAANAKIVETKAILGAMTTSFV